MTIRVQSTIAQVLYPNEKALDFARIVAELETILARLRGHEVRVRWDCDDLVTFDLPEARILLATAEFGRAGQGSCLTVSVGPSAASLIPGLEGMRSLGGLDHAVLCSRLVERIQYRFVPAAILWQQVEGMVDADLVDGLADGLPQLGADLPPVESILDMVLLQDQLQTGPLWREIGRETVSGPMQGAESPLAGAIPKAAFSATAPASTAAGPARPGDAAPQAPLGRFTVARATRRSFAPQDNAANDRPDLPRHTDESLTRLRAALYPAAPTRAARPSTQLRLAAHCLNATLILVYAPLGAAVMTYSLLQGEDIRFSARMMAVVGTVVGLSQTPLGQTVAAMAAVRGWR